MGRNAWAPAHCLVHTWFSKKGKSFPQTPSSVSCHYFLAICIDDIVLWNFRAFSLPLLFKTFNPLWKISRVTILWFMMWWWAVCKAGRLICSRALLLGILSCYLTSKCGSEQSFLKLCKKQNVSSVKIVARTLRKLESMTIAWNLNLDLLSSFQRMLPFLILTSAFFAALVGVALYLWASSHPLLSLKTSVHSGNYSQIFPVLEV